MKYPHEMIAKKNYGIQEYFSVKPQEVKPKVQRMGQVSLRAVHNIRKADVRAVSSHKKKAAFH